jgi:hypothetical protein
MKTEYQYLVFKEMEAFHKTHETRMWLCNNKKHNLPLGEVKWYAPWRQYCYFPISQAVYSDGCLKDIVDFIEQLKSEGGAK